MAPPLGIEKERKIQRTLSKRYLSHDLTVGKIIKVWTYPSQSPTKDIKLSNTEEALGTKKSRLAVKPVAYQLLI